MSTTIAGVRFSDQLAALLDHAIANGWRVEADARGKATDDVVIYAPDKAVAPIRVSERGAKFNRSHYENIRRDLYRGGLPPLPADAKAKDWQEEPAPAESEKATPKVRVITAGGAPVNGFAGTDVPAALRVLLADPNEAPAIIGGAIEGLAETAGLSSNESQLLAALGAITTSWALANRGTTDAAVEQQITEALDLAAEAERKQAVAEKALVKARKDCGDALRRAEKAEAAAAAAEAQVRELNSILDPLRTLLAPKPKED